MLSENRGQLSEEIFELEKMGFEVLKDTRFLSSFSRMILRLEIKHL